MPGNAMEQIRYPCGGNGPVRVGAVEWTRTTDLLITNQLLYQLSYNSFPTTNRELYRLGTLRTSDGDGALQRTGAAEARTLCMRRSVGKFPASQLNAAGGRELRK